MGIQRTSYGFMAGYQLISLFALGWGIGDRQRKDVRARVFNSAANIPIKSVSIWNPKSPCLVYDFSIYLRQYFRWIYFPRLGYYGKINNTNVSNNSEYDSLQGLTVGHITD